MNNQELALANFEFWQAQAEELQSVRVIRMSLGNGSGADALRPMHELALRRLQKAREELGQINSQ